MSLNRATSRPRRLRFPSRLCARSKSRPNWSCSEPSLLVSELTESPKRNSVAESKVSLKKSVWRSTVLPSLGILEMNCWMCGSNVSRSATCARVKFGLTRAYNYLLVVVSPEDRVLIHTLECSHCFPSNRASANFQISHQRVDNLPVVKIPWPSNGPKASCL